MQRGLAAGDEWSWGGGGREGGKGGRQGRRQGDRDEGKKGRGEECKREEDVEQKRVEYLLECPLAKKRTMLVISFSKNLYILACF